MIPIVLISTFTFLICFFLLTSASVGALRFSAVRFAPAAVTKPVVHCGFFVRDSWLSIKKPKNKDEFTPSHTATRPALRAVSPPKSPPATALLWLEEPPLTLPQGGAACPSSCGFVRQEGASFSFHSEIHLLWFCNSGLTAFHLSCFQHFQRSFCTSNSHNF